MAFNPLSLLKGVAKIGGKLIGIDIEGAIRTLEGDPSPEVQAQLAEFDIAMRELAFKELETEINAKVDLMKTEILSGDKFVRRARPTGLYISYACSLGLVAAVIVGVDIDPGAILTLLGPLMGYSSWYTFNRTQEKKQGRA